MFHLLYLRYQGKFFRYQGILLVKIELYGTIEIIKLSNYRNIIILKFIGFKVIAICNIHNEYMKVA